MSVLSFDDFPWSSEFRPQLTALAQPAYEIGSQAMGMLLSILEPDAQAGAGTSQQVVSLKAALRVSPIDQAAAGNGAQKNGPRSQLKRSKVPRSLRGRCRDDSSFGAHFDTGRLTSVSQALGTERGQNPKARHSQGDGAVGANRHADAAPIAAIQDCHRHVPIMRPEAVWAP